MNTETQRENQPVSNNQDSQHKQTNVSQNHQSENGDKKSSHQDEQPKKNEVDVATNVQAVVNKNQEENQRQKEGVVSEDFNDPKKGENVHQSRPQKFDNEENDFQNEEKIVNEDNEEDLNQKY